jgi:hypothetical protein
MSEEETKIDGVLHYPTKFDANGIPIVQAPLTDVTDTQQKNIMAAPPYIIPVVFLPGLMGTNLKMSGKDGKVVWRPPNADMRGAFEVVGALVTYLFKTAKQRKADLAKDAVEIDLRGPIDTADTGLPEKILRERGWGGVMRACYHPMMGQVQTMLSAVAQCGALTKWAKEQGQDDPADWGEVSGQPALTKDDLMHVACYRFEVWGGGYNWLASNRDSGRSIKTLIEGTILPWYKKNKLRADKVIVYTHSMGGLVSRALTELHTCDKVMGVIHGVQPATGAGGAFKRMRAGFEGAEQVILGRDAADVTAILAAAPGPLELLPAFDYNDGKAWLKVRDKKTKANADANSQEYMALPTNRDPYSEIYQSTEWFGLIPAANEKLMEPGKGKQEQGGGKRTARDEFDKTIAKVAQFHHDISEKYCNPTYAHYGRQGKKQGGGFGGDRFIWGDVVWEGDKLSGFDPTAVTVAKDDLNGKLTLADGKTLEIAAPDCPGDGTVPWISGAAPTGKPGVAAMFRHGQQEGEQGQSQKHNQDFCYDHQNSYLDKRAAFAALYGIVKIAQKADWHE